MSIQKILMVGAVAGLFFTSCSDFLDQVPDDRTIIDSSEKVGELLVFAYPESNHSFFTYSMSDNCTDKGTSADKNTINRDGYFWNDFIRTDQDTPENYWGSCYKAIAHANQALEYINENRTDGVIANDLQGFYGEALLCRAYCHYMLVTLWSKTYDPKTASTDLGIPYVTEPENVVFKNYTRGTVESVFKNIEADLIEGLKYLDENVYENAKLHWNKKAASTFAARFYSIKGDFDKVLKHCNNVFEDGNVAGVLRDLNGQYVRTDINERVVLWSKTDQPCNLLSVPQYSNWFVYTHGRYQYAMSYDFYQYVFRRSFVNGKWIWDLYGSDPDIFLAKYAPYKEQDGLSANTGYWLIMNNIIEVEEALFLRMEANAMLGNFEAVYSDMDAYLSKRTVGYSGAHAVTQAKMDREYAESVIEYKLNPHYAIPDGDTRTILNCVYDFRRKEFYYSGRRWFDILRYNTAVTHYDLSGDDKILEARDLRKQIQIPSSATQYGIQQNPR